MPETVDVQGRPIASTYGGHAPVDRPVDDKGRIVADHLSTKEALTEMVTHLRALTDALELIGNNPMLKAMMPAAFSNGKGK